MGSAGGNSPVGGGGGGMARSPGGRISVPGADNSWDDPPIDGITSLSRID